MKTLRVTFEDKDYITLEQHKLEWQKQQLKNIKDDDENRPILGWREYLFDVIKR